MHRTSTPLIILSFVLAAIAISATTSLAGAAGGFARTAATRTADAATTPAVPGPHVAAPPAMPSSEPALATMVGQLMVVGVPGRTLDDHTRDMLQAIRPGGIILYTRNFTSLAQVTTLIRDLQAFATTTGNPPYFIMVDEEPSGVSRFHLLDNVVTNGRVDWSAIQAGAAAMESAGITVDLAPLADLPVVANAFDARRVPMRTRSALRAFNDAFIQTLAEHHVFATLKHFPGAGMFVADPHHDKLDLPPDAASIAGSIELFESGIDAGAAFVMTNHAVYASIDPDHPATLSHRLITDVLRSQLKFKGIILTDDIEAMLAPVWHLDPAAVGAAALRAGDSMLMYAHNIEETASTTAALADIVAADPALVDTVRANYRLVLSVKAHGAGGNDE